MKQVIGTFIGVVIIIILSVVTNKYLYKSSNEILNTLNSAEIALNDKNFEKAKDLVSEAQNKWENNKNRWSMIIDHQEIDKIDVSIAKSIKYIESRSYSESIAETTNTKLLINHVPDIEKLSLVNIF